MKKAALLPSEIRAISGLSSLYAVRMLGLFMILPVLSLYSHDLSHATPALIGLALGIYGLTQACLQIPFGMLSDRFGRKIIIASGLLLFIVGSVVAACSSSIEGVIAGRALQGSGAVAGAIMALLADHTREEVRTTAMATIGMSIGIAFAIAMAAGPLVARFSGLSGIFWITACLATASLVVLWKLVPSAPPRAHHDVGLNGQQIKKVVSDINLLRLDYSIFSLHLILTACFVAVPLKLKALGIAPADHGMVYLPVMASAFVAMVPLIIIAEKYHKMRPVFIGTVISLVVVLLIMAELPNHSWWLLALLWLFFIAFNLMEATLPSMISKIAPAGAKGTAMGLYSTSQFLGASAGGMGGGLVASYFSSDAVFLFCSLAAAIWLIAIWKMPAPRHLSSEIRALSDTEAAAPEATRQQLLSMPGVVEAFVVTEEKTAYLKVERAAFEAGTDSPSSTSTATR
ncbi:MFS transporter [Larsenimonas rhizosphaerae]|uniref:MFS transporter n=1 Tax=Larsenimonas rhizosphaerae TaxID=2944682 RepID=UPI002034040F|nr:MFS transporter [Larsenimonas rhizosphaerae]MCM2132119.1 MFS transporter [Larsenimonas rhizosphaerae]